MSVIKVNGLNLAREVAAAQAAVEEAETASTAAATSATAAATARTGAETAQTAAETARDEAVAIVIADADAAMAAAIETPGSATATSLSASTAATVDTVLNDPGGPLPPLIDARVGVPGSDKTVFVSKGGNDSNDGLSQKKAFLTVAAALAALPTGGTIRIGWGTFNEAGLTPVDGTVIQGVSRMGTILNLVSDGTLLHLPATLNCGFIDLGLRLDATVTTGKAVVLDNAFNNHFHRVTISGFHQPSGTAKLGQVGIHTTGNAGDNMFHEFVVNNLGVGAQLDSQTNYFVQGKFSNNDIGVQGGDPTGVIYDSGANFVSVVWNNEGTTYVNLNGTSQAWSFESCWFDGAATNAMVIGVSGTAYGPGLVFIDKITQLAGRVNSLVINAAGYVGLGSVRFGAASGYTPTDLVIDATNAPAGTAMNLKPSTAFEFLSTDFPNGWTYFPRSNSQTAMISGRHLQIGKGLALGQISYYEAGNGRARFGYDGTDVVVSDAGGGRSVGLRSGSGGAARTTVYADTDGQARINGGLRVPTVAPGTYPYTILVTDVVVLVPTGTAKTVNLPAASTAKAGHTIIVKDSSGGGATNNITIVPDGTDTIDGAASRAISTNYGSVHLVCNGTSAWHVV